MQKIHTKENLADVMTKPINTDKFKWCRFSYGLSERKQHGTDKMKKVLKAHQK